MRRAQEIKLKEDIDKKKIRKEYADFITHQSLESSDEEYEEKNFHKMLKKKEEKGSKSVKVMRK